MTHSKLSKSEELLIASYLAGENVEQDLLKACKSNPAVLKELSSLIAIQRVLASEVSPEEVDRTFTNKVLDKIELSKDCVDVHPSVLKRLRISNWSNVPIASTMSIVIFVCFLLVMSFIENQREFATVTNLAATYSSDKKLALGRSLGKGDYSLTQGFGELTLSNGVVLVLEAPVKFTLKSVNRITLRSGKLVARVPENAIGFRIDTPSSEIIDLGTEFGVNVEANGNSQVHVLEGEVKARSSNLQSYKHLTANQALAFNQTDTIESITSDPKEFMRVLPGHSAHNPNYLHWSFDNKKNNRYSSVQQGFVNSQYDVIDKSPAQTPIEQIQGVYGQALQFNGDGNWLETSFPGIGKDNPRTVSFWLKVPKDFSVNNAYGIISWGLQQDYASWQISPNPEPSNGELGRLRIGTYNAQVVGSTDLRDDQWHHIAVVLYGGESSNISTHVLLYVDGVLEKTQNKSIAKVNTKLNHPKSKPMTLGRNIGFNPNAVHETQNYFKGSVDELYVFEAALSQQQILQLMSQNTVN